MGLLSGASMYWVDVFLTSLLSRTNLPVGFSISGLGVSILAGKTCS